MEHSVFAYCPLSYDGEFYPEAPPGCALTPLMPASPGLLLCICHITDLLQFESEFESVRPYLVGERLHKLLHSALRWPPALALARLRSADWEEEHLGLDPFEERMNELLQQCLERQNRIPAQLLPARANVADLRRGEYYWVLQGSESSKWVRWVSSDFRLCEGPSDLFRWSAVAPSGVGASSRKAAAASRPVSPDQGPPPSLQDLEGMPPQAPNTSDNAAT